MEARKRLSNPSYGPLGGYDDDNEGDPNEEFELQHQSVSRRNVMHVPRCCLGDTSLAEAPGTGRE